MTIAIAEDADLCGDMVNAPMILQTRNCRRRGAGFCRGTVFLDILLVFVVIGLLAAILFPIFGQMKERSRQTSCASNLKQLGSAFHQYLQDNDQKYPPSVFEAPQGWAGRIYPYVRNTTPYHCPDDTTAEFGQAVPVSYLLNANLGIAKGGPHGDALRTSDLKAPDRTVLLYEGTGYRIDIKKVDEGSRNYTQAPPGPGCLSASGIGVQLCGSSNWGGGCTDHVGGILGFALGTPGGNRADLPGGGVSHHGRTANYLAADGHVAAVSPGQISTGTTGTPGKHQDEAWGSQATATDNMLLRDGATRVVLTFSPK